MEEQIKSWKLPDAADLLNWIRSWKLSNILFSVVIIVGALILWKLFRRAYLRFLEKRTAEGGSQASARTALTVTYDAIKLAVILGVTLTILQINGVNVTSMVAGLSIVSAIVALAFQDLLKDVIMGVHIVTDDFFKVGDVVCYGAIEGQVISFNIRTTKLRDLDQGNIVTICNRNISEIRKRSNLTLMNVPLSYEEDFRKVHRVLGETARRIAQVEGMEDCVYKGTHDFGDSAIIYRLNLYCPPEKKWEMWRAARSLLQEDLDRAGIAIPYPQMDVHLDRKGGKPADG